MNAHARIILGVLIVACGGLVLANSANMSFQGYERQFSDLIGVGFVGVGVSGLAFLCAGAVGVAAREGLKDVAIIAAAMAAVCYLGDIYGNDLAVGGDYKAERTQALDDHAAWTAAVDALPRTRAAIEGIDAKLEIIAGGDIKAAQRFLKSEGEYFGRIDGAAGGLTEKAMEVVGEKLRADRDELQTAETVQAALAAQAEPVIPSADQRWFGLAIATLLSTLSIAASAIGFPLIVGKPAEELEEEEAAADILEATVFDLVEHLAQKGELKEAA